MRAIGYTRLSQQSDTSIDRQKRKIEEYCESNGFDLDQLYDDGQRSSGFDNDRSEYQKVKQRIQEQSVDIVVVHDKTRIGRDFDERMQFVLDLRATGVQLHSARRGYIDLSDPTDAAVESVHAAKDDEGARELIEKAREAVRERIESGYYQGTPPFGLTFDEEKKHLVPGEEFETAMEVVELRDSGESYATIGEKTGVGKTKAWRICQRAELYRELDEATA